MPMFFIRGTNYKKVTYGFLCSYFVGWKVSDEQLREVAELSGLRY